MIRLWIYELGLAEGGAVGSAVEGAVADGFGDVGDGDGAGCGFF